jgi:hypothetical protein
VNDANAWARILGGNYSYEVSKRLEADATREGILDGLKSIVGQSQPKDRVIITFSGHGTFVPDDSGDEADKADEAWCPYDVTSKGAIKDDEIAAVFRTAPKGVRIVMISDSCHSGTMARAAIRAALPDEPGAITVSGFCPPCCGIQTRTGRPAPLRFIPLPGTHRLSKPRTFISRVSG